MLYLCERAPGAGIGVIDSSAETARRFFLAPDSISRARAFKPVPGRPAKPAAYGLQIDKPGGHFYFSMGRIWQVCVGCPSSVGKTVVATVCDL